MLCADARLEPYVTNFWLRKHLIISRDICVVYITAKN